MEFYRTLKFKGSQRSRSSQRWRKTITGQRGPVNLSSLTIR
ncbi:hypothetical protein [Bacillus pseudomycoides]|nr:hypothetical protein [Bacillus pseudomycoides]MED1599214.1 hypothetical protein [Bacillus pseudomycoides]MED4710501.1 hypothetical protein [Bacillus pseudomycoides]